MVLLAVLRLGEEAFGLGIQQELQDRVDRRVSRGALYVTLDRLEGKGLLTSRIGENAPGRAGRPRRMLSVTPVGLEALRRARGAWMALWDGMEGRLEEA